VAPVVSVEVQRYEDTHRSKGWALAEFEDHQAAVNVVSTLNGQECNGRQIHLRLERSSSFPVDDGSVRIFVGNLAWSVSESDLLDLFSVYSPQACHIMTNMYGRSRGFAILTLSHESAAMELISCHNGIVFQGRPLDIHIDRGNCNSPDQPGSRKNIPGTGGSNEDTEDTRTSVYVGKLGNFIANDEELLRLFVNRLGGVCVPLSAKVQMATSGRSKGWGIVKFQSSQDAKRAVEAMHGLILRGQHALEVRLDRK
jgi:polyadenylate-binding protein